MQHAIISASILSADFSHLYDEVSAILDAGADQIHFDVMDHHFVPNLTFGANVCKALRKAGITAPIDVHLMVEHPEQYITPFAKAGASLLCFHPETVDDVQSTLHKIREAGMQTGLAFNPDKPIVVSDDIIKQLDMILLMSVFPGFGGQQFIPESLEKIESTREKLDALGCKTRIGVDGGIKTSNIHKVAHAGADFFVLGSGLFHAENYKQRVAEVRKAIR